MFFLSGFISQALAQTLEIPADPDTLPQIDKTFFIEGDQFTFQETPEGLVSVWEGNVYAYSKQVVIRTDRLEVDLTEDDRIRALKASPDVTIEITDDRTGSSALVTGKVFEFNFETETGRVDDSIIELIMSQDTLDYPLEDEYKLYILAEHTNIIEGDLEVNEPRILFNSLDSPELTFSCKQVGINTFEGKRYLKISMITVRFFGIEIFYFPWTYYRSLSSKLRSGLFFEIPSMGMGEDGLELDQKVHFAFRDDFLQDKYFTFRMDIFTEDRWYPEILFSESTGKINWDIIYGYENQKRDFMDESVRVFRNPDFNWRFKNYSPVKRFTLNGGVMYGYLEEPQRSVDSSRLGFELNLEREPIPLGRPDTTLILAAKWRGNYYAGNEDYSVFTRSIGIRHLKKGSYSVSAMYHHRDDKGFSPFLHDREDILDEIEFRTRMRLSDEWSTGFTGRYDVEETDYLDLQMFVTRIFNSFQVSVGWDFADNSIKMEFGLPGAM